MTKALQKLFDNSKSELIKKYPDDVLKLLEIILNDVKSHKYSFIDEITDIYIPISKISNWKIIKKIIIDEPISLKLLIKSYIYKNTKFTMSVRFYIMKGKLHVMLILYHYDSDFTVFNC